MGAREGEDGKADVEGLVLRLVSGDVDSIMIKDFSRVLQEGVEEGG